MKNKKNQIILIMCLSTSLFGQNFKNKNSHFPIWTFHQDSVAINGLSVGLWTVNEKPRNTITNGLKFELIGVGLIIPIVPSSPIVKSDSEYVELSLKPISERINGLNLSTTGTVCHCVTNGLTAGFIGQLHYQVNGISAALYVNYVQKQNGVMIGLFNDSYFLSGLQVGLANSSTNTKGAQIGAFNTAKELRGIQIGVINESTKSKGLQLGLWNKNEKRKLPLINWNFKQS